MHDRWIVYHREQVSRFTANLAEASDAQRPTIEHQLRETRGDLEEAVEVKQNAIKRAVWELETYYGSRL